MFFIMNFLTEARQLQEIRWATEMYNSFTPFENQTFQMHLAHKHIARLKQNRPLHSRNKVQTVF